MNVRVGGRVCLLGEHDDWYGGACLTLPLDRGLTIAIDPAPDLRATAVFEGRAIDWADGEDGPLRFVGAVADEVHAAWGAHRGARVHVAGDLPPGRGFSSSAAMNVALVRGWAALCGRRPSPEEEAELAYRAERAAGVPCGRLDPLACAWGLPLFLRFDGDAHTAEPLPARLSLAIGSFDAPRDTAGILAALQRLAHGEVRLRDFEAARQVGAVRDALDASGARAVDGRRALVEGDLRALGAAMNACQDIYEEDLLPVVPELHAPRLIKAVRALRAAGALGAKFSGAGGDGSVIGLFPHGRAAPGVAALDRPGTTAFALDLDVQF